jgi:hypothetical protein
LQGFESPINECEHRIKEFCRTDFTYEKYDLVTVPEDSILREDEIRLANKMVARMSSSIVKRILQKSQTISAALSHVPPGVSLLEVPAQVQWSSLERLFESILVPGVLAARATKILYKKRPQLIPILDSRIQDYSWTVLKSHGSPSKGLTEAAWMIEYCKVLRGDLESSVENLKEIQMNLRAQTIQLSLVRILDILVWSRMTETETGLR